MTLQFLSTLSLRRATGKIPANIMLHFDFYPRSPCGERLHYDNYNLHCVEISIHALLAESDGGSGVGNWPRVIFLSTLSLRRATAEIGPNLVNRVHFYPRSPCGERQPKGNPLFNFHAISIHALLAESDRGVNCTAGNPLISIHALLAESDRP